MNQQTINEINIDHCANRLILYGDQSREFRSSVESAANLANIPVQTISHHAHQRAHQVNTALLAYRQPPPLINLPGPHQTKEQSKRTVNSHWSALTESFGLVVDCC